MLIRFEGHVPYGYTHVRAMQYLQCSADLQNAKNKAESFERKGAWLR